MKILIKPISILLLGAYSFALGQDYDSNTSEPKETSSNEENISWSDGILSFKKNPIILKKGNDEILINVGNISELLLKKNAVTQCPGLTYKIHELVDDDILVVFMVRDWSDILSSVWRKNKIRYGRGLSDQIFMKTVWESSKKRYGYAEKIFNKHVDKNSYFLDAIYKMWKYYQKHQIKNTIELNYESMNVHELWIDKSKRKNFTAKQTK